MIEEENEGYVEENGRLRVREIRKLQALVLILILELALMYGFSFFS